MYTVFYYFRNISSRYQITYKQNLYEDGVWDFNEILQKYPLQVLCKEKLLLKISQYSQENT